jgi:hypothetical protein
MYDSTYSQQREQKKTERECKQLVCSMLLRLGHQPLVDEMTNLIRPYVVKKSSSLMNRLLGRKMHTLKIPSEQDAFWNGQKMSALIGLDEKNLNLQLFDYDPYFWMAGLIRLLPFQFWTTLLECDVFDAVGYFLSSEEFMATVQGERKSIFREALVANALMTRDSNVIEALSQLIDGEDVFQLVPFMKQVVFEQYMRKNKHLANITLMNKRNEDDSLWSLRFTKEVIEEWVGLIKAGKLFITAQYGNTLASFVDIKALDVMKVSNRDTMHLPWHAAWNDALVAPVETFLQLKQKIDHLKRL